MKPRAALRGEVRLQHELMNLLREGKKEEHHKLLKLRILRMTGEIGRLTGGGEPTET